MNHIYKIWHYGFLARYSFWGKDIPCNRLESCLDYRHINTTARKDIMKRALIMLLLMTALTLIWAVPREMVVLEITTGTWCPYCPGASIGAHDLLEAGINVAVVKNHGGDSYENAYSSARNSYYGVSSYPSSFFDGLNVYEGGHNTQSLYSVFLPRVNARLAIPSKYTITAEGSLDSGVLTVDVTVSKPEADTNTNVFLRSYITESNIQQNWQGQTQLDYVNRLMAPSATGTAISLDTGESVTHTLTFNLNSIWQLPNLELVLFLQNNSSKEILQGTKYSVPGLAGAYPVSTEALLFPDTYVSGLSSMPITFYNFSNNTVSATMETTNPTFFADITALEIPALSSATTMVHFVPSTVGDISGELVVNGNFPDHPVLTIPLAGHAFVNAAPLVADVSITGPPVVLQTITGTYVFSDPDGDNEGTSIYEWYKVVNGNNQLIPGENEITYDIAANDINKQFVFKVTPVDQYGMAGTPVFSDPSPTIVNLPSPQNFAGYVEAPNTAILTWEKPMYFNDRGFVGYRLFRNDLVITDISDPDILTYSDADLPDGVYNYKLCSIFNNPQNFSLPTPVVTLTIEGSDTEDDVIAAQLGVSAMPNPFQSETKFQIKSSPNLDITFQVFNIRGQLIRNWKARADAMGNTILNWDGKDDRGDIAESGVYLYRMESAGKRIQGKIIRVSK